MGEWPVGRKKGTREGGTGLGAADWEEAALDAMTKGGLPAVAVEPLARRLGVTKGSFYWHFRDRAALVEAMLARWERDATEAVIAAAAALGEPVDRLRRIFDQAFPAVADRGPSLLLALSDASSHPAVGRVLRRVSRRRIDYLAACYREIGFTPGEAEARALLAYAAYLGTLRLRREAPDRVPRGQAFAAFRRHLVATLGVARRV
jgi:AcrR family transcriptional regulator